MDKQITAYINQTTGETKKRLQWIYQTLLKTFPKAETSFAYQMPTFKQPKNFIHFAVFKEHIGIYPGVKGILFVRTINPAFLTSKGAWRLPHQAPFPKEAFLKLCQWIKDQQ